MIMFENIFNALFLPKKIINSKKSSIYIPLVLLLLIFITPLNYNIFKNIIFMVMITFVSTGLRLVFSEDYTYYQYFAASSPLIFSPLRYPFNLFSFIWTLILKIYIDIKKKNYISALAGTVFDIVIIWWYM